MIVLMAIPILGVLAIVQSAIVSAMPLLFGAADLILVTILAWAMQDKSKAVWQWSIIGGGIMTFMSAMPVGVYIGGYLVVALAASLIRRKVWKVPFLGMLAVTFLGTLLMLILSWLARWLSGVYISIGQAFNLVILPSMLLNLLLSVPAYFVMKDLAGWLYPKEIEA
jgi:hypothetical protein